MLGHNIDGGKSPSALRGVAEVQSRKRGIAKTITKIFESQHRDAKQRASRTLSAFQDGEKVMLVLLSCKKNSLDRRSDPSSTGDIPAAGAGMRFVEPLNDSARRGPRVAVTDSAIAAPENVIVWTKKRQQVNKFENVL
jgi:hypothetical protein